MSESGDSDGGVVTRLRTVTPPSGTHPDAQMNFIGWVVFAGLFIIMLPVLPLLLVIWLFSKVTGGSE